ncbi:MAG TPA: hypothetical protein VIH03_04765, partial [Nitrososphaerales archaeon]
MMRLDSSGVSKIIAVVAAVVIVVGTASAYFFVFQSGAPAQQQVSPGLQPAQPPAQPPIQPQQPVQPPAGGVDPAKADALKAAVEGHFSKFAAKDVIALMADYTQTGTYAEWSGQAGAFAGKYNGYPRIRILYATIAGN